MSAKGILERLEKISAVRTEKQVRLAKKWNAEMKAERPKIVARLKREGKWPPPPLMKAKDVLKKTAKKNMPDFLDQNRPKKVKEIYSALKRDHPDMPAEMKARIAARQGKKGHQKQGPPYKGPIKPWKEKKAMITDALNDLWLAYTPDPNELEKSAAAEYFYDLRKPSLDAEALGDDFCKLAEAFDKDPWQLACDVEDSLEAYGVLAKTASDPRTQELAQYYVDWADELEKRAIKGWLARQGARLMGGGGMQQAAGQVTRAARQATVGAPASRSAVKASRKAMAAKETARRSAARAQSQAGSQAALQRRSSALGTNTKRQQKTLKKNLMAKRQGANKATSIPKAPGTTGPGGAMTKKKGFTTGEKAMGAAVVGVPAAGGMYLAGQSGGQQQPGYR